MSNSKNNGLRNAAIIGGAVLLGSKIIKEVSGSERSANYLPSTNADTAAIVAALKADPYFVASLIGGTGRPGTGLIELLLTSKALPADLTTLKVGDTVRSDDNLTTYLVIQVPVGGTLITNTAYFKEVHGPDFAGPEGKPFTFADFTPAQLNSLKVKGADGLNAPSFAGLMHGLAGEGDPLIDWHGVEVEGSLVGLPLLKVVTFNAYPKKFAYINTDRLIKVSGLLKGTGTIAVNLFGQNLAGTNLSKTNGSATTKGANIVLNADITPFTHYVGGRGILSTNFAEGVTRCQLNISKVTADVNMSFSRMIVENVSLGEPVPSNLPWLPAGQMVYDTITGGLGRYNGTTVVWS